jgi:hypothetical protein
MSKTDSEAPNAGLKRQRPSITKRLIKGFLGLLLLGVAGIALLLGLMLLDHNRETTLPTPTGPFTVGRTT